jgi:hypothetical protein
LSARPPFQSPPPGIPWEELKAGAREVRCRALGHAADALFERCCRALDIELADAIAAPVLTLAEHQAARAHRRSAIA